MSVVISQDSDLGRELWKWDHTDREVHPADADKPPHQQLRGVRPSTPVYFPKMLYKAKLKPNGQASVGEVPPNPMDFADANQFERACLWVNMFNQQCQRKVNNEDEQRQAEREGWIEGAQKALEKFEGLQQDIAKAAAETNWGVKRMSKKAQREHADADSSTHEHVVDVAGSSKRRGRKPKASAVTA